MKNLNLIRKVAHKFEQKTQFDFKDLFGEAALAYCEARERFDPENGAKFTTFAYCHMSNMLINYCQKENRITSRTLSLDKKISQPDEDESGDEFLHKTGLYEERTEPVEQRISQWPAKCRETAQMVLDNPEAFEGITPHFERTDTTPKQRVKNALRNKGYTYEEIWETIRKMKTVVQTL